MLAAVAVPAIFPPYHEETDPNSRAVPAAPAVSALNATFIFLNVDVAVTLLVVSEAIGIVEELV